MSSWRIGIVFCGGCNPRIDRGQIAAQVRTDLLVMGYEVWYNSLDVDFVIYMSGCTANCALKYNHNHGPCAVVAAATLDAVAADTAELVTKIVMKVRDYFEQLEKTLST
jgi:sulfite reductase beta subunit-like hemoprotein